MNRSLHTLLLACSVLPLAFMVVSDPICAASPLQGTSTSSAFLQPPLRLKSATATKLTATPRPTPAGGKPAPGNWGAQATGFKRSLFTVSSDSTTVCSYSLLEAESSAVACGMISQHHYSCSPIDGMSRFTFTSARGSEREVYRGNFTSSMAASGDWAVSRWWGCTTNGTWNAGPTTDQSLACRQFGTARLCAWVSDPTPARASENEEIVYAQFFDKGIGQPGLMSTIWHFETEKRTCREQVTASGLGLQGCVLDIAHAKQGYTVSIDVTITYNGQPYTVNTSFTPR